MTNKQKYPYARIEYNQFVGDKIKGKYFIRLKECTYLLYDGTVGGHKSDNPNNTFYKNKEEAQQALDKFMEEKEKQITLQEIKDQYKQAKKLIGKKIKNHDFIVQQVQLIVEDSDDSGSSYLCDQFLQKNGFVIILRGKGTAVPYTLDTETYSVVTIKAHDGLEYEAKNNEKCWKFGCAEISKQLIKKAFELMDTTFADGNRQVRKITIGACNFNFDTLKKLVEADV